jgi:hypothetical protein
VAILKKMPEQEKSLRGQDAWIGLKQPFVEYGHDERKAGGTGRSGLAFLNAQHTSARWNSTAFRWHHWRIHQPHECAVDAYKAMFLRLVHYPGSLPSLQESPDYASRRSGVGESAQ